MSVVSRRPYNSSSITTAFDEAGLAPSDLARCATSIALVLLGALGVAVSRPHHEPAFWLAGLSLLILLEKLAPTGRLILRLSGVAIFAARVGLLAVNVCLRALG